MNPNPDSPFLAIGIAIITGAIAYGCHRFVKAIEANRIMPLSEKLRGDKGRPFPMRGTWPFHDKHHAQFVTRSHLHALALVMKWGMIAATVLLGAVYPVSYLINFAGR